MQPQIDYQLLDSGDGAKLERFGERVIRRPSTLAIWKRRLAETVWKNADAEYNPDQGWKSKNRISKQHWTVSSNFGITLLLRLQDNGQIGVFPEHSLYLPMLVDCLAEIKSCHNRTATVLNLFGYTGLASLLCLKGGAVVTHVDLAKSAQRWLQENIELNSIKPAALRMITEDAINFCKKEVKRQQIYDVIIVDPPNFSRVSKTNSWTIEAILPELIDKLIALSAGAGGTVFLTTHGLCGASQICTNLVHDSDPTGNLSIASYQLFLQESTSKRQLPAGSLLVLQQKR